MKEVEALADSRQSDVHHCHRLGSGQCMLRCSSLCINHPLSTRSGCSTRCWRGRRVQVGRAGPIGHCRRCTASTSDAAQDAGVAGAGRCWRFKVRRRCQAPRRGGPGGVDRNIRAVNSAFRNRGERPSTSRKPCMLVAPSATIRSCGGCRVTRSCPRTHRRRLRHGSPQALRARRL